MKVLLNIDGTVWLEAPSCLGGSTQGGWVHVANVYELQGPNPGLELIMPLGLNAVVAICDVLQKQRGSNDRATE